MVLKEFQLDFAAQDLVSDINDSVGQMKVSGLAELKQQCEVCGKLIEKGVLMIPWQRMEDTSASFACHAFSITVCISGDCGPALCAGEFDSVASSRSLFHNQIFKDETKPKKEFKTTGEIKVPLFETGLDTTVREHHKSTLKISSILDNEINPKVVADHAIAMKKLNLWVNERRSKKHELAESILNYYNTRGHITERQYECVLSILRRN